jgi:hypothetical protein
MNTVKRQKKTFCWARFDMEGVSEEIMAFNLPATWYKPESTFSGSTLP